MHPQFAYALENLHRIERELTTHPGRIKERLLEGLYKAPMFPEQALPEDLQELWKEISTKLTSVEPQGDEGSHAATIGQMDEETAIGIAWRMIELVEQAEHYFDSHIKRR